MAGHKLLFFGVHGDSPTDQGLAARLMEKIASKLKDKTAIGFEQVINHSHDNLAPPPSPPSGCPAHTAESREIRCTLYVDVDR